MEELDLHYVKEDPDLGIPSEGILCRDMEDIVSRISKVKNTVEKINLDNQSALTEIPDILGECKLLEELNISHTKIKSIPDYIFTLPALRSISCCCSDLTNFPMGLIKAANLEVLHLRINNDWTVPKNIFSMPELKVLFIDLYSSTIPDDLGTPNKLEVLSFFLKYDDSTVPELLSSFKDLPSLNKVSIYDPFHRKRKTFDLLKAAKILSTCPNLETLKITGLAVGSGHQGLASLTGLKNLELRHLQVEGKIFDSIANLNNLEKLDILGSDFKITEIPDIFMNMQQLQGFSFAGNMVLDLPPSIYSLSQLKTLEIGTTGISSLDEKIGSMQNLEKIQIYDNILETLPVSVFSLPNLKILNIEENLFSPNTIRSLRSAVNVLAQKGRKIEFMYEGQGLRHMVKKLRGLKNVENIDPAVYAKHCLNAVYENSYALKYMNVKKLNDSRHYTKVCMAAVRKNCTALENVETGLLSKGHYFYICMEAAKNNEITAHFKLIKSELLADHEFIQVCIMAALHNNRADFLDNINSEAFQSRFKRDVYERICWAAVLHYPQAILKMIKPIAELKEIARKLLKKT